MQICCRRCVDDWWRVGCGPSYDHSDHLDLFLRTLRHRGAAALLLFALTGPGRDQWADVLDLTVTPCVEDTEAGPINIDLGRAYGAIEKPPEAEASEGVWIA